MIAVLMLVGAAGSSRAQSSVKVKLTDNSPLNVAVDGRYFNKRGTSVTVGDLPPGKHFIQVYSVIRGRRGRGREEIIYEGKLHTTQGMVSVLTYDPYSHRTDVQDIDLATFNSQRRPDNSALNNNPDYNNNNQDNYRRDDNNFNRQGNYANGNGRPASAPVTGSLTDAKIDQLKTNVAGKKTDTDKSTFLRGELKDEQFTTTQLGVMLDWFSFESSKEEFAEWAYNNTVDKESFPVLENKFTFKTYQDQLDKFLKSK